MKIAGIDFPKPLLDALRDNTLVVFAGAGISRGEPAYLPDFKHLAKMIAQAGFQGLQDGEEIDRFLGRLQHDGVKVHERAAEVLSRKDLKATDLHRNLLRFYSGTEQVRVVTTNFDLLFERAAEDVFGRVPAVFRAPALPLGRQFAGIVHVHGAVDQPGEMVLTDADFGRAYLTEGWTRRFLVELFSNFTILFVGYSYDDTIMRYLTRALPPMKVGPCYALMKENDADTQRWSLLGIDPIAYPQPSDNDYSKLDKGIRGLADLVQRSVVDWHREITEIAGRPPPLDEEAVDLIQDALGDETKTRFFTKAASDPKWIDWLDQRGHLNALFEEGALNKKVTILSWWLAKQFVYNHANKLFLLIGKHNMHLHRDFWENLCYEVGVDGEASRDKKVLSRWISLLLATDRGHRSIDDLLYVGVGDPLYSMAERCIEHELLDSLLQIFDAMAGSCLRLKRGFYLPGSDENEENLLFDVELPLIGEHEVLNSLWESGLKPKLPQVAEPLLDRVIKRLEEQYSTLHTWGRAHRDWDPTSYRRSAIEPHEQDGFPRAVDVLIDAARDCLEWLASNQVETAAQRCSRLVCSDASLLRRLAVHAVSKLENLTVDDKIDWLLTNVDLHESSIHHEIFQAVWCAYPEASAACREKLVEAVLGYSSDDEEHTARVHFDWFDWLLRSDSNCALARGALDAVSTEYPHFEPKEHPDLTHWVGSGWVGRQNPPTAEELMAKPAMDWLGDLLSFQSRERDGSEYTIRWNSVREATRRNFDWGLGLADALHRAEQWDIYLWSALIDAWSTMELDQDRYRKVFHWLDRTELYPKHHREIARVLYALVKDGGRSYALNLLPQANEIATALWRHLSRTEPIEERGDWLIWALNHTAGNLANFWLFGFSIWRKEQNSVPTGLSDEYHRVLSEIVQDQSLSGRLGRTILASQFPFLLAVDEVWTKENLIPLFDPSSNDFQAAWAGFLTRVHLNPAVAEEMVALFLKAVERIDNDLANQREPFVRHYTTMLVYFVEAPLDEWIPKLFHYGSQETKDCFAWEVASRLRNMTESEQQEWWHRWLRRYWENRLQSVPVPLESSEVTHMLNWLPSLASVLPEAVDLAIQMPQIPSRNSTVVSNLAASDLCRDHPEAVAKLLVYLWKGNVPGYYRDSVRRIIDTLLPLEISLELKRELEGIKIQL